MEIKLQTLRGYPISSISGNNGNPMGYPLTFRQLAGNIVTLKGVFLDIIYGTIKNLINDKSKHKKTNFTICIVLSGAPHSYLHRVYSKTEA